MSSKVNTVVVKLPYKEQRYVGYNPVAGGDRNGYAYIEKVPLNKGVPEATLLTSLRFSSQHSAARALSKDVLEKLDKAGLKTVKDLRGVSKKRLTDEIGISSDMSQRLLFTAKLAAVYVPGAGWPAEVSVPVTEEMVRLSRVACNQDEGKAEALLTQLCANYVLKVDTTEVLRAAAQNRLAAAKKLREQAEVIEAEAKEFTKKAAK